MVRAVNLTPMLSPQGQLVAQQLNDQQPVPKYTCASCAKLQNDGRCDCFQRPVDKDYNKCFNHSRYNPIQFNFKAPNNIEEIARKNEDLLYA